MVNIGGTPTPTGHVDIVLNDGSGTKATILEFDGPVTGSAGLHIQGGSDSDNDSEVIFAGNNNMTGGTTIKGGQVIVESGSSIGTGSLTMAQTSGHQPILILNNPTQSIGNLSSQYGTQTAPGTAVTQTIQLNGTALTINETDFSGTADYGNAPADSASGSYESGSQSIITGSGSIVYAGAPAGGGNPAAYLSLSSVNTYGGGTTVTNGTLATTLGGTLGGGPLSFLAAAGAAPALSLGTSQSVASLSNSTTGTGTSALAVASGSTLTVTGNLSNSGTLTVGNITAPGASSAVGGGTVVVNGNSNLAASSQIVVNAGTLQFNATSGQATVSGSGATAPSVTVSAGATLQLAGNVSALSDPSSGNLANVNNNGSATGPGVGGLQVTGTNQSVGVVSGTPTNSGGTTTYSGDTVVASGAGLTATQILQNSLTIGAGSTVTIRPSGSGSSMGSSLESGTDAVATTSAAEADNSDAASSDVAPSSDPLMAIQSALASDSISAATGERLENRIAAIEQLAMTNPGLDISLLESRILAALPASSPWSSSGSSPQSVTGASLLSVDSSEFSSSFNSTLDDATAAFSSAGGLGGGVAVVPEPSSLLLAGFGAIGLALLGLRRRHLNSRLFQS
jgi:hypothetical protein